MTTRRLLLPGIVLALAALALGVALGPGSSGAVTPDTDPVTSPIPDYDTDDPGKAFVVDLDFGASSATLLDAFVSTERSYSHLGDPPLLQLRLLDEDGNIVGTLDAWDPRWTFDETPGGGEQLLVLPGPGTLFVPFDSDVGTLVVRDQQADSTLVTVDLRPAVREFCLANPDDIECVEADLAVTGTTATGTSFGVVGETTSLDVDATVENLGPDGPVDGIVTQTVTSSAGLTVSPTERTLDADGLAVGTPQEVTGTYDVTCEAPGAQSVTVTSTVEPRLAKVADLDGSNDSDAVTFDVDCAIPVTVNVKPGSLDNPVSDNERTIPVAVLTTEAGEYGNPLAVDATSISAATVRIGLRTALVDANSGVPESHGRVHIADVLELDEVTRDGDLDALLHGDGRDIPVTVAVTELCVRGRLGPGAGVSFFGCDAVSVVPR
jgi:hypothetical protein